MSADQAGAVLRTLSPILISHCSPLLALLAPCLNPKAILSLSGGSPHAHCLPWAQSLSCANVGAQDKVSEPWCDERLPSPLHAERPSQRQPWA